jgi:hypothetical protein
MMPNQHMPFFFAAGVAARAEGMGVAVSGSGAATA